MAFEQSQKEVMVPIASQTLDRNVSSNDKKTLLIVYSMGLHKRKHCEKQDLKNRKE
jgi:hypothetical protein